MSGTQELALGSLTSRWRVAASVPQGELKAARCAIAGAISLGKSVEQLDPMLAKQPAAAQPITAAATVKTLAFVQNPLSVTVQNPLGTPAWARGMAPSKRLGPFIDALNLHHIVPIFPITTAIQFSFAGAAGFAVFPVEWGPHSSNSLRLGAGSVWFSAPLLAAGAAAGSFTGFLISDGELTASAALTLQNGAYVVPDGATLTLTATLAPPAAGSGAPGADLTSASIALPASVTIEFTQTSAAVTALSEASLILYGSPVSIAWPSYAVDLLPGGAGLVVVGAPDTTSFGFNTVQSTAFVPSGSAKLVGAGWMLPIAATTITALGEAAGAGSLLLVLAHGAAAKSQPTGTISVDLWEIVIDPSQLFIEIGGTATTISSSYTLWPNSASNGPPSSVAFATPAIAVASFLATPGREILTISGKATAFLDRPLAADGGRLPISGRAILSLSVTASGTRLAIIGEAASPSTLPSFSVALENALIGIQAPSLFYIGGPVAGAAFTRADAILYMASSWLIPTLPDPYAANFNPESLLRVDEDAATGLFAAGVLWNGVAAPTMAFEIGASAATEILAPPYTPPSLAAGNTTGLTLLDLSTKVDLFGVAVYGQTSTDEGPAATAPGVVGLAVALPVSELVTFALPQISWEPMQSVGPEAPLGPIYDVLASDGPPTLVYTRGYYLEQTLVPVEPEPVLLQNIANVAAGDNFSASFGLPFGLIANIRQVNRPGYNGSLLQQEGGAFGLVQPSFPGGLAGAYQLSLQAPNPTDPKAQFSGTTTVSADGTPGYGYDVLSSDVGTIFEGEFGGSGGAVPINRVDLSGYGASLFTEWTDNSAKGPAIIKVQFETIRGRTAYEVVKAQTTLYPYCVPLVRTITIARQNGGAVTRSDSGWVAAAPGLFEFPSPLFPQNLVNRGAIAGVYNVRNVTEFELVTITGFTFRRCTFDADVGLDQRVKVIHNGTQSSNLDASGNTVTLVPATGLTGLTGYVQLTPDESASGPQPPHLLPGPADFSLLFATTGAITNALSCVAEIGYTPSQVGTQLRTTAFEIDMATTGPSAPALGVALLSAPILPKEGAWGFGKRGATTNTPAALPANAPVPLVQAVSDAGTWHFADIADVLQLATPATIYGLLQDTGTQRTLFEQPLVKDLTGGVPPGTVPGINLPPGIAPALADIGSLLNATGVFPQLSAAISLVTGAAEQLQTIPQGLFYEKTYHFTGNEAPTTLLDLGILQVNLIYADTSQGQTGSTWNNPTVIQFAIDPAHSLPQGNGRDWWFSIAKVSFAVVIPEFGADPLLTIIGGFEADNQIKPGLTGLTVDYGSALDTLKSIFSKLQALAAFLPGGGGASLDVSLSNGQLTVEDTFALPTLPLGLGNLSDISLDLGLTINLSPLSAKFIIGIGDPDNPFNWVLSPLAGNGAIDIGVQDSAPYFMIQGGIGLGLSIDLGIAEGSASITLAVQITVNGETITLMIILNGQASVDVLGGLASASLSLTAAVGVSINPLPVPQIEFSPPGITFRAEDITFIAAVSVGIHITLCWVVSINFDGSWQFSQSVHTPSISVES